MGKRRGGGGDAPGSSARLPGVSRAAGDATDNVIVQQVTSFGESCCSGGEKTRGRAGAAGAGGQRPAAGQQRSAGGGGGVISVCFNHPEAKQASFSEILEREMLCFIRRNIITRILNVRDDRNQEGMSPLSLGSSYNFQEYAIIPASLSFSMCFSPVMKGELLGTDL